MSASMEGSSVIRTYCLSWGLSPDTAATLENMSIRSLDHLKALEDKDLDSLDLPLGERVLLRSKINEHKEGIKTKGLRYKNHRHEYTNATYKNDSNLTSWIRGTFILTQGSLSFVTEDNRPIFLLAMENIYHITKSDSTVNIWPFRTNALNIFADNMKHKVHLGVLRDSVYDKLSVFFESRQFKVD